jgi:signal transduction histidine kinase
MTLRSQLVLAAAYILLVVVIAFEVPIALNLNKRGVAEFRSEVLGQTAVAAGRVADAVNRAAPATRKGSREPPHPAADIQQIASQFAGQTGARMVILDRFGRVLADSFGETTVGTTYATAQRPELGIALSGSVFSEVRASSTLGENLMVAAVPVWEGNTVVGAVRSSAPMGQVESNVHRVLFGLGGIGLAVILIGLALAWLLATSLARRVRSLQQAAIRLGDGDLDARATPGGPQEVATLAVSFNRMADAVSASMEAQGDFVANASHHLRTPLTGLRLRLEAMEAEGGERGEQAHRAILEADRLANLVEDLLRLETATAPPSVGSRADIAEAARDAVEHWTREAERADVTLSVDAPPHAPAWGDDADLAQVLDNLIENAIRYGAPGAEIRVRVEDGRDGPRLSVSDSGPGIGSEERTRVFERFFRGTAGRAAGTGTGLGLSIVSELVRRWGGEVRLLDGAGTTIEASFPPLARATDS